MRDVQNQADARGIAIQRVGIKDAQLPFLIKTKDGGFQQVLARILFTVALPMAFKGTHMSGCLAPPASAPRAALTETQGSSPISPLLTRADEKYVTEAAYENPKFVEDILRDTVLALRSLPGIAWFSIECENYESIHNHNAFAAHEETVV